MNYSNFSISNKQSLAIALSIVDSVSEYVDAHPNEYRAFLESEKAQGGEESERQTDQIQSN